MKDRLDETPPSNEGETIVTIKLDQFLKREGFASTGGHAKILIQSGEVKVDGVVETRRGRKLQGGETIQVESHSVEVVL